MKKNVGIICFLFIFVCFAGGAGAGEDADIQLITKTDTVAVNWSNGVVHADGRGVPPDADYGDAEGRKMALAGAIKNARQKLLEVIERIPIDSHGTVGNLAENNVAVLIAIKEMVDVAEVIHQEFSTDGAVTVTVRMSMNGGFSQLVLPAVIKQIESVKPMSITSKKQNENMENDTSVMNDVVSGPYTGMIVDVRGIRIMPCMAPRVCDENGQEIFGPAYASREFAVQHGMTGYVSDLDAAAQHPRVADRPLILKGLRSGGAGGNDIIVSNTDAARLRSAFENLTFLRQCRVLIVVDSRDSSREG